MQVVHGSFPPLHTRPVAEQERLEVAPDEWRRTDGGFLISEYADRCVLVVAHNDRKRSGIVGHFTDISIDETDGRREFENSLPAIGELGPQVETWVWLGGAVLFNSIGEYKTAPADREYAKRRVAEHLPHLGGIREGWTPEIADFANVHLDAGKGILTVEFGMIPGRGMPSAAT